MSNENEERMKWLDDEAEEYKKQLRNRFKLKKVTVQGLAGQ